MKLPNLRSLKQEDARDIITQKLSENISESGRAFIPRFLSQVEEDMAYGDLRLVPKSIWNALARKSITASNISDIAAFVELNGLNLAVFAEFLEYRSVPPHFLHLFYTLFIGWVEDDNANDLRATVVSYHVHFGCKTTLNLDIVFDNDCIEKQKENVPSHIW